MEAPASPTLTAGQRPATAPARAPQRRRRRPAVLALGVALVAAGGLGGAALYLTTGQRVPVLALAHDVPAGSAITADDLTVVQISLDPALHPLNADSHVLDMRATTDLKAGQMLTAADLTNDPLVLAGQAVLGVSAKPEQLPATGVQAGAWVSLVYTPSATGNGGSADSLPSGGATGAATTLQSTVVRVVSVGDVSQSDGTTVVDVAVPQAQVNAVADLVASGKFAVLLAPPGTNGGG
ncbi:SAF domain-containing protein [Streptacidiphilus jiangxiensis]|uniref:SAF domain-containing protein n=1 Tax=Streptacidiphilus jiangxiensis TaxID=235985 RepID=A0A1H7T7T5_STRJI|nr:SAF domain-containing protein [Streptacidiphilus jiangxiensis]SEL80336.1 SAF domain-containing protein [Streptacidiphilus jiangxiensis]